MLSADTEDDGHAGGCPGCAALASHKRAIKPHNNECRERTRTIIGIILTGNARVNAYKDRVAETVRVIARTRARVERGAGDVLMEPKNEEQMTDRHAVASGVEEQTTPREHDERRPHWQRRVGDSK